MDRPTNPSAGQRSSLAAPIAGQLVAGLLDGRADRPQIKLAIGGNGNRACLEVDLDFADARNQGYRGPDRIHAVAARHAADRENTLMHERIVITAAAHTGTARPAIVSAAALPVKHQVGGPC
jgi:hypothetical protein